MNKQHLDFCEWILEFETDIRDKSIVTNVEDILRMVYENRSVPAYKIKRMEEHIQAVIRDTEKLYTQQQDPDCELIVNWMKKKWLPKPVDILENMRNIQERMK